VTTGIGALISRLDDPSDISADAKAALIAQGASVIPELAAALPGLDRFGKLSAIQVFEAFGDRRAGPALVIWRVADHGQLSWTQHDGVDWAFDRSLPWSENVVGGRDAALLEAEFVQDTGDLVAMIEWIDESDVAIQP
jgi:hypothetical protein